MITIRFTAKYPGTEVLRRRLEDALLERFSMYIGQQVDDDLLANLVYETEQAMNDNGLEPWQRSLFAHALVLTAASVVGDASVLEPPA